MNQITNSNAYKSSYKPLGYIADILLKIVAQIHAILKMVSQVASRQIKNLVLVSTCNIQADFNQHVFTKTMNLHFRTYNTPNYKHDQLQISIKTEAIRKLRPGYQLAIKSNHS